MYKPGKGMDKIRYVIALMRLVSHYPPSIHDQTSA